MQCVNMVVYGYVYACIYACNFVSMCVCVGVCVYVTGTQEKVLLSNESPGICMGSAGRDPREAEWDVRSDVWESQYHIRRGWLPGSHASAFEVPPLHSCCHLSESFNLGQ